MHKFSGRRRAIFMAKFEPRRVYRTRESRPLGPQLGQAPDFSLDEDHFGIIPPRLSRPVARALVREHNRIQEQAVDACVRTVNERTAKRADRMTADRFQDLKEMRLARLAKSDADCARLLGVAPNTIVS